MRAGSSTSKPARPSDLVLRFFSLGGPFGGEHPGVKHEVVARVEVEFDVAVGGVVVEDGDGAVWKFLEAAYLEAAGESNEVDPVDEAIFDDDGGEVAGLHEDVEQQAVAGFDVEEHVVPASGDREGAESFGRNALGEHGVDEFLARGFGEPALVDEEMVYGEDIAIGGHVVGRCFFESELLAEANYVATARGDAAGEPGVERGAVDADAPCERVLGEAAVVEGLDDVAGECHGAKRRV